MPEKRPFDIDQMIKAVERAVKPFPKAALFELAEEGYSSTFEILVACIVSIRTRDETTLVCARQLFEKARTPEQMIRLGEAELDETIRASTFHEGKTRQILSIARQAVESWSGIVPCDEKVLLSFDGVGPKCANLVLGIACGQPRIAVDIHVHRVVNRWGYVSAKTPEKTMAALQDVLPDKYHVEINRLLVPFGKHICTDVRPKCSTCPVLPWCRQVGVTEHR